MEFKFLEENIQIIRKLRGVKQQELADAIGINMQSLSKIERGVNHPILRLKHWIYCDLFRCHTK